MTAELILAGQPEPIVNRLMKKKVVVISELREEGAMSGGLLTAYVLFDSPIRHTYEMLSHSERQAEFRVELTGIETIEVTDRGQIDEHRMKILFTRYVYRLYYQCFPEEMRIEWTLDERFDNDFQKVDGFWQLYELPDGRTLGVTGTSIDVGGHVPGFVQDWMTRRNLPKTMQRARIWVNSRGAPQP